MGSDSLEMLAWGRIGLGLSSLASPAVTGRVFGIDPTPEVGYLTRIYGGRAIALGAAYLLAGEAERERLQLLSLGVDISDTATGLGHLLRRDGSPRALVLTTALTGTYAAVGAVRALRRHARRLERGPATCNGGKGL
ncbi:hypothetical protein KVF89_10020 [Nocardioides carbamazepini]|uniref:hypothetical protein n=1 Tax=Nocardioides carbamazepini TaxID=2854259 RepID=UPI00214A512D|nr:hypothetical protein [Nocardioides carbamazepini]MCR1782868.1 hypothetical protein [Nocardioides carbamazepini]